MPIVAVQQAILGVIDRLPMPNGNYLLEAYVTPPDPETDYTNPHAYIWPTRGSESRKAEEGGAIPRNTGVGTPAGTKAIRHNMEVFIRWFGLNDDPQADTWFPGMVDAVMWALRTAADPLPVTDPYNEAGSQVIGLGEVQEYHITVRSTEDEAYLMYDGLITCPLWEIFRA